MARTRYRRWSPPASPVRIEFREDLFSALGRRDASGMLYGLRKGPDVRVSALNHRAGEELEKIGVFFSRIRGEVFLTEADIDSLNQQKADLALVVVGNRAGFFVRALDGSIQSVRSYEEFSISRVRPAVRVPRVRALAKRRWLATGFAGLALPLAALTVSPHRDAPRTLEVHDIGGQLRISWTPAENAVLTIGDGGKRLSLPVFADQSSVTYIPRASEIEVSLSSGAPGNDPGGQRLRYAARTTPEQ